ncbi:MAG: signal peptidase I [Planctomycetes bacterium]|nr:signal peptidase I [Planctomycetota bacterium]
MFLLVVPFVTTLRWAPVLGASMEPTLHNGQTICYRELPHSFLQLERGDLVVFNSPVRPATRWVKRIVGMPGDELRFEKGQLWVNGEWMPLPQKALNAQLVLSTRVPDGEFFALGDHAAASWDSRVLGAIPLELVVGRVVHR